MSESLPSTPLLRAGIRLDFPSENESEFSDGGDDRKHRRDRGGGAAARAAVESGAPGAASAASSNAGLHESGYSSDTTALLRAPKQKKAHRESLDSHGGEDEEDDKEVDRLKFMRNRLKHLQREERSMQRQKNREHRLRKLPLPIGPVFAVATCRDFSLGTAFEHLKAQGLKCRQLSDVIYVKERDNEGVTFVFYFGVVVFWSVPEERQIRILADLRPFETRAYRERETEEMDYLKGEESNISHDQISLKTDSVMEKLAVSFALAQSTKLSVFERSVENEIEISKRLPEELAMRGQISLSSAKISKQMGRLFMERSEVNLTSEILDTPEFFWEDDRFLPFFKRVADYLEIDKRVDVLNRRLDVIQELLHMLTTEAQSRHASKLEWIIIWLIVLEVFIEIFWNILVVDVLGLVNGRASS